MKVSRIVLLPLAVAGVIFAAGCGGSEGVPADAVAVVDGTAINRTDLTSLLSRARKSYEQQKRAFPKAGTQEYQSLQTQAVAYLVQRTEYELEADQLGISIAQKDVDKRLADVKKQYFGGSEKRYQAQLKQQGYTAETFADDIRAQLLSEKLYEHLTNQVKVTDAEVKAYYEKNKQQYVVPETREVRHILVKTKAEADRIYDQLEGGADFAALAKAKSLDPGSKENGGKLTISRGQTVPPFDQTAFLLSVGTVSKPVKTEFGYHLIEPLGAVKEGRTEPLSKVEAQIRSQLEEQGKSKAIEDWAKQINDEYKDKVDYAEGFAPPPEATTSVSTGTDTSASDEK